MVSMACFDRLFFRSFSKIGFMVRTKGVSLPPVRSYSLAYLLPVSSELMASDCACEVPSMRITSGLPVSSWVAGSSTSGSGLTTWEKLRLAFFRSCWISCDRVVGFGVHRFQ